jgi:hypothetical protein
MAMRTLIVSMVGDDSGQAFLEMDYDDAQGVLFSNAAMAEVRIVNGMSRSVATDLRRPGGQSWATVVVGPGETWRKVAGGSVRRESDLASFNLRTV